MSGKKTKAIRKQVKKILSITDSHVVDLNGMQDEVLGAAINAQPVVRYERHKDQTNVPKGKVRVKPVVVRDADPERAANRFARKLSKSDRALFLSNV